MIPVRFIKQGVNVVHPYSSCASTFVYEHNHKSKRAYLVLRTQKRSEPIQIKRSESNLSQFI
jgi:hypothetical protein